MRHTKDKPIIGIVMGDPAGIGPEVALKSLAAPEVRDLCHPVLIGDYDLFAQLVRQLMLDLSLTRVGERLAGALPASGDIPVVDIGWDQGPVTLGVVSRAAGEAALRSIRRTFDLALDGQLDGIVMAPINKASLAETGSGYHSEFELFADLAHIPRVMSVVKWGSLYRTTVTGHVPFREIAERLNGPEIVAAAHRLRVVILRFDDLPPGRQEPRLAVAALNPHGGEGGLLGDEERTIIAPAIASLAATGLNVVGPIPADTIFVRAMKGEFDGLVFLYHDQGNIAMKAVAFGRGVVIYTDLPMAVVTPGHGSAYDIAGRGIADEGNMTETLRAAASLASVGRL